jgi:hypothetical protein
VQALVALALVPTASLEGIDAQPEEA